MGISDIKAGRLDISGYVIHFTRRNGRVSSFDILTSIVSDGYIKPGWSERGQRNTVFGSKPAIL